MILNLTSAFFIFSSVTFGHWLSITLTWSHKSALRHNKNSKKNNSTISTRKSAVYLRGSKEKLINNQTPPYELLNGGAGSMCQEGIGTLQIVRQGTFTHSATALTDSLLIATKNYWTERNILKTPHRRRCKQAGFSVQHQPITCVICGWAWECKHKKRKSFGVISLDDGGGFISMAPLRGFSAVHQRNHKVMPEEQLKTRQ